MAKKSAPEYRRYACPICYHKRMLKVGTHYCDCWPGGSRMTDCSDAASLDRAIKGMFNVVKP